MQERDRFTDALLRDDLRKLNSHLPKNRRTLGELLDESRPAVQSVSGDLIKMKRSELEDLVSSLTDAAKQRLRLPIILLRRTDLGPGAFTVLGDPYEEYAMLFLSGSTALSFEEFKNQKGQSFLLYKPQVSLLLRRFHSLVAIGLGSSGPGQL